MQHDSETTWGTCRSEQHRCRFPPEQPCLSASMSRWEPSIWDLSQYGRAAGRRPPDACGLLRGWSDLDRTGALAAHLTALDEELRS
jgi:hypothetical protein